MVFNLFKKNQEVTNESGSFEFNFTKDHLRTLINNNPESDEWYEELCQVLPRYDITTPERVAGFIAQCSHESRDFRSLEENLNYSESALNRVFKRYFGPGKRDAKEYAYQPEKIANYVYMDKYRTKKGALGNIHPGDGWRFRGKGIKQLTGRNNVEKFAKSVNMTADQASEYLETKKGAVESACWFWDKANCNSYADRQDIVGMSKAINGGTIGLSDRKKRWEKALKTLGSNSSPVSTSSVQESKSSSARPKRISQLKTLRIGSRGDQVKMLQEELGISSDGMFGPGTQRALKEWQRKNGLASDGIAGVKTLRKIYNI